MSLRRRPSTPSLLRPAVVLLCCSLAVQGTPLSFVGGLNWKRLAFWQGAPKQAAQTALNPFGASLPDIDDVRRKKHDAPKKLTDRPAKVSRRCNVRDAKCLTKRQGQQIGGLDLRNLLASNGGELSQMLSGNASSLTATDAAIGKKPQSAAAAPVAVQSAPPFPTSEYRARLDRRNRVGGGGEDLLSGNYNWSLPLIDFAGRAGLDFGLTLSYNSKVWLRHGSGGNDISFDADIGSPTPGFRLGFPTLDGPFYDRGINYPDYILLLPSGARVGLRHKQNLAGGVKRYEANDGSYLWMQSDATYLTVYTTDGTALKYEVGAGYAYHRGCVEVRDRFGNFLTVKYDYVPGQNGQCSTTEGNGNEFNSISEVIDTAGRHFYFTYDCYNKPKFIYQMRGTVRHDLVVFDYENKTIDTNFQNGYNVYEGYTSPVLTGLAFDDGTEYRFDYTSYIQVKKIHRLADAGVADTEKRAWVEYNLPEGTGAAQYECPAFTKRTDHAFWWSQAEGVETLFSLGPANNYAWGQVTTADGTSHKEYFDTSYNVGTLAGLTTQVESRAAGNTGTANKTTSVTWQNGFGGAVGLGHPRPLQVDLADDAGNVRSRQFTYTSYNLPTRVDEYGGTAGQMPLLRYTTTSYELSTAYTDRRLIGRPKVVALYDASNNLASKVECVYDDYTSVPQASLPGTPVQYGAVTGTTAFGNVTQVRRYDVTTASSYVESKTKYHPTGTIAEASAPEVTDGATTRVNKTTYSYSDVFSTGGHPTTLAYPTTITDADGFASTVIYDYHLGAVKKTTDPKGASVRRDYRPSDDRLERVTNEVNGAYTRYEYDPDQFYLLAFSTIQDGAGEFLSMSVFDGYDRQVVGVQDHPGSAGGYRTAYSFRDSMGRMYKQSNPTETTANWAATGDDAAGFRFDHQAYDWQGRATVYTHRDADAAYWFDPQTNPHAVTRQVSYSSCGCAGGDVTTVEGELVPDDNGQLKRRTQKVWRDPLGRERKSQVMGWDGLTPYATTITEYNVRDQVTSVKEYGGDATGAENCPSTACQITNLTYDGHGRLWKQRRPAETADNVYLYYADDTLQQMTDPRGVSATYSYNSRQLVTGISYAALPNATLPSPLPARPIPSSSVTFGYDEAGNRTWMDDAPGRVDYTYDQLSRLKEETRLFDVGGVTRSFTLKYGYNLGGQLKQITDPWNATVTYALNKAGEETGITATGYKDVNQWTNREVTTFASDIRYRAWGGIKQLANGSLGGNNNFAMGYDARLRLTSYTGGGRATEHDYYNDGRVKEVRDLSYGSNFRRTYEYDQATRLTKAHAGGTAQTSASPYSLTYGYDSWGNTTSRQGSHWSQPLANFATSYVNNRDVNMTFDAAGQVKGYAANYSDPYIHYTSAGELFTQSEGGEQGIVKVRENYHDGEGAKVFYQTFQGSLVNGSYSQTCRYYTLRSTALGGKVLAEFKDLVALAESDPSKYYSKSYVYLRGVQLASQEQAHRMTGDKYVVWSYHNPVVGNYRAEYQLNDSSGQLQNHPYGEMTFDPLGSFIGLSESQPIELPSFFTFLMGQYMDSYSGRCYADGVETPCTIVQSALNNGWGAYAPSDPYQSVYNPVRQQFELTRFTIDWENGFYGFVPLGASYHGDGTWSWNAPRGGRPRLKGLGQGRVGSEADGALRQQAPAQLLPSDARGEYVRAIESLPAACQGLLAAKFNGNFADAIAHANRTDFIDADSERAITESPSGTQLTYRDIWEQNDRALGGGLAAAAIPIPTQVNPVGGQAYFKFTDYKRENTVLYAQGIKGLPNDFTPGGRKTTWGHEFFHIAYDLGDADLAKALGLNYSDIEGPTEQARASQAISRFIAGECK
jgi:YD repeat-containing protein